MHRPAADEPPIPFGNAVTPLGVSLAPSYDFNALGEPWGHVLPEPKRRAAVGVSGDEHGRHRGAHRFSVIDRKRNLWPRFAGGLLLAHPIIAEKSTLRLQQDVFFVEERHVLIARNRE